MVSVMTNKHKEIGTVVRDEKDDRLLAHQIRCYGEIVEVRRGVNSGSLWSCSCGGRLLQSKDMEMHENVISNVRKIVTGRPQSGASGDLSVELGMTWCRRKVHCGAQNSWPHRFLYDGLVAPPTHQMILSSVGADCPLCKRNGWPIQRVVPD